MEKEIWKDIIGFEGLYQISSYGKVKRLSYINKCKNGNRLLKEMIRKNLPDKDGYKIINLFKDKKMYMFRVHRLVAIHFLPKEENYKNLEINHKDEVKHNNFYKNLEWCTSQYNSSYGSKIPKMYKKVGQFDKNWNLIKIWQSPVLADRIGGFNRGNICACATGRHKTHFGFKWRYL